MSFTGRAAVLKHFFDDATLGSPAAMERATENVGNQRICPAREADGCGRNAMWNEAVAVKGSSDSYTNISPIILPP